MDALINVADQARTDNDAATYVPLYRACASRISKNDRAAWCAWRAAFDAYHTDQPTPPRSLLNFIKTYPGATDTSDALYFLGRLAEKRTLCRRRAPTMTFCPNISEYLFRYAWPGPAQICLN